MATERGIADGIRVLEIGSSAAVGIAGMTLADAGAEVTMVESPEGSPLRHQAGFAMWGRGKQSLVLDLARDEARARLRALIETADVLLVGLKAASSERFGLDYASLEGAAPRLVHASVTGMGRRGPLRDVPVYDAVVQARGGRMYEFSTLHGGERPAFSAAPVAMWGAAMALLAGVFGALRAREENGGRGQAIETDMVRALTTYDLAGWVPGGPPPLRLEDVPFLPYSIARTRDGVWIQFAQNGPALFADFLRVLGLDREINYLDAMRPSADTRIKRAHRERVQNRVAERTWAEWQEIFAGERNLSVEPFLAPGEALDHPQFQAIGDVLELPDAAGRPTRQLGPIFDVPGLPLRAAGPAPRLGERLPSIENARPQASPGSMSPDTSASACEAGPGLLSGVTILELGMWIALPFAASWLAELGARVIKLEPLEGDPMRSTGPVSWKLIQGKESLAIDLKHPDARRIVHRLVARADALLHSYRPGVPERLGIDYETLREINPRLVHVYNGSYGSRGPRSFAPAFHVTGGAVAGGAWAQAGAGYPPTADASVTNMERAAISRRLELANEANPDFNSAVAAAAATLMGLFHCARTGQGLEIETRMMLSNAMMMSADFVEVDGRPTRREVDHALDGLGPLYRLYEAAKGWVFVAAPQQRDFQRLCAGLDHPALADDPRFATAEKRAANAEALTRALAAVLLTRSADAWENALTSRGVACVRADVGPCSRWLFEQAWAHEQRQVVSTPGSESKRYLRYGAPVVNDRPVELGGAIETGEHTRALLLEIGFPSDEIERLILDGVVAVAATS